MTKDEAAQLVHDAIVAAGPQDQILGAGAFAQRLATALNALGLLNLAEVYGVAPSPQPQEISAHADRVIADATPYLDGAPAAAEAGRPEYWASKRNRT